MKTHQFLVSSGISLLMLATIAIASGCKEDKKTEPDPDTHGSLFVKFLNDTRSVVSISFISVRQMGAVPTSSQALINNDNIWSDNLLTAGKKLTPGEYTFFPLSIPNLHYAEYRLGIDPGNGTEILLHNQPNYVEDYPPITHRGGDDRTVSATVWQNETSGNYYISGWSDFAGISN